MTNMRDEIATIVWLHKDYSEGYDAADAIMELVQARIEELEAAAVAAYEAELKKTQKDRTHD